MLAHVERGRNLLPQQIWEWQRSSHSPAARLGTAQAAPARGCPKIVMGNSEGWSWKSFCPFLLCSQPFHLRAEELGNTRNHSLAPGGRMGQQVLRA